ncbi:MAG: hypothetical protein QOJ69_73 [Actinomycetota bacterium]|jgi:hypothetical protein|nr:hypothetical protein [Actinomycetota bacterium]
MHTTTNQQLATPTETTQRRQGRAWVVIAAVVAAVAVWLVARLAGANLTVEQGSGGGAAHVGLVMVAAMSALAGLAGWGLLAVIERSTPRARTLWTYIALGVLAISLVGPLGAGTTAGTKLALVGAHLATAAVLIPGLRRTADRART